MWLQGPLSHRFLEQKPHEGASLRAFFVPAEFRSMDMPVEIAVEE